MSIMSDDKDAVEEERRLCYVGITRAREKLTLTMARQRMTNGETRYSRASRFVEEIPAWLLEQEEQPSVFGRAAGRSWGGSPSASSSDRGFGAVSYTHLLFVLPSKKGGLPELLFLLRRILLPQLFGQ